MYLLPFINPMENRSNALPAIAQIITVIAFGVIAFFCFQRIDKYMRIKAVDDCGRVARYERTVKEEGAVVTYPLTDMYQACLQDKGY